MSAQPLYERFRPSTWAEVVGQDKAVARLRKIAEGPGVGGRAFWLTGPSGSGKTTLARIVAGALKGARVHEFRCADELTAAEVADLDRTYHLNERGLFSTPTAVIVNEAHGLTSKQVRTLLGLLEPIPRSFVWVFTTTWAGQNWLEDAQIDATALLSRCVGGEPIRLTNQGLAEVMAKSGYEKCNGRPLDWYMKQARASKNNFRAFWQSVEDAD